MTTMTTTTKPLPSAMAVGLSRTKLEVKQFFREREQLIFTFFFPIIFLGIFSAVFSGGVDDGKAASAVVTPVVLLLQFMSGVYFVYSSLPAWMRSVAEVFPLKWLAQGMRSVFLPDSFEQNEPGGSWQLGIGAIMLTAWLVVGLLLAQRFFRWTRRDAG